jgi:tetratricopeptide (TPR) repeat protein
MSRIAILAFAVLAALPAFSQKAPKGAVAATGAIAVLPPGPHPKSKAESDAYNAIGQAKDPDSSIAAVDALMKDFPDTDYKAVALQVEAESYHQKRDETKAITYAEQALAEDPKSFYPLLLLAEIYSQNTRPTDLDLNDRLTKSDKYAQDAIAMIGSAEKPNFQTPDTAWAGIKKAQEARAWEAMGLAGILRKKFDDAKTDLQKSMDLRPDPVEMLRIGRAYAAVKRFDDAVAWADKVAASPASDDNIKRIAASDRAHAQALQKQ